MESATGNGAPAAVEAEGLSKDYRLGEHRSLQQTARRLMRREKQGSAFHALGGVDFTVRCGESFGIVGTNGSGKSTVLQILAGTTLPTGGRMVLRGRVVPLLAVGTGFHPELTGQENVRLFGASLGFPLPAIEERMEDVATFAELHQHMDTPVKRYSSGMVSRLSFAIAMSFPADTYVFDEVLAVVDGEFQSRCLAEIKRLHSQGRTVIFVSHDLSQIRDVCSRVMWLEKGLTRSIGATEEVLEAYTREHPPTP